MRQSIVLAIVFMLVLQPALYSFAQEATPEAQRTKNIEYIEIDVRTGTPIEIQTIEDIYPSKVTEGDSIFLMVTKDVTVDGYDVIKQGALVRAEIYDAKEKGMAGQAGRVAISFKTVEAVDGTNIIISGSSKREGDDKMLESVGLGLVCCPLFLLMKGEEGVIKAAQTFNVFTIALSKIKVVKK